MLKYLFLIFIIFSYSISQECLGGELRTIESYTHGRYEVNMKPTYGDGYVSSFFTYHDFWETTFGNWQTFINEIDIEFTGNTPNSIQLTTHHPGPWSETEILNINFNPFDEYHTYAFEWTPSYIKWFIDNEEVYTQPYDIVLDMIYPQKIMLNIWATVFEDWAGEWGSESLPVYSYYDFIKYYSFDENNGNYGTDNNFSLEWTDDFDTYDNSRWTEATHSFDGNRCQFSAYNTLIHNGMAVLQASNIDVMLGDINADDIINISDIVACINIILNFHPPINASDYNQDNYINIIDAVSIVGIILGE